MGFLQDLVDQLPGATTERNPLMGGQTLSEFYSNTHTGSVSDNGFNAIYATDPTIQMQRMGNIVDKEAGGEGNIFTEKSMQEQAGIANTIGKMFAADWAGGLAGSGAESAGAASGGTAAHAAYGAAAGGSMAGMNDQSIAEGAAVGAIGGALAPTTDPSVTTQATPSTSEMALRRAGQSAATTAVKGGSGDEILTSAGTGAISGTTSGMSPTLAGAINGAVNAGIGASKNDQPAENGIFYGALTGAAGGAAYDVAGGEDKPTAENPQAQENELAGNVAGQTAAYAAGQYAQNNLPVSPNRPEMQADPQFEAYLKELNKGYSPQIQEGINPLVLAAMNTGAEVPIGTQQTQGGISPLLLQGA